MTQARQIISLIFISTTFTFCSVEPVAKECPERPSEIRHFFDATGAMGCEMQFDLKFFGMEGSTDATASLDLSYWDEAEQVYCEARTYIYTDFATNSENPKHARVINVRPHCFETGQMIQARLEILCGGTIYKKTSVDKIPIK